MLFAHVVVRRGTVWLGFVPKVIFCATSAAAGSALSVVAMSQVVWTSAAGSPPVVLTTEPIGDGSSYHLPYFCQEAGLDADLLWEQFQASTKYVTRASGMQDAAML